jgi:N-acetylneuraminate synthase
MSLRKKSMNNIKVKKPYLIAEIGINHNGSIALAKKIIKIAKENNFDAVKFQKRDLEICIPENERLKMRDTIWGEMTYMEYKKKIEFQKKEFDQLVKFCKKIKIDIFCSAFDINSLKFLKKYQFRYNKVPSAMITNKNFLLEVAKQKRTTFISTGMCQIKDIEEAVKIFKKNKCKFILMHCVSEYPCPEENLNLNLIKTLKKKFKCEMGYSGHESSVSPSLFAWVLGANYIERHVTDDRSRWGTDQSASLGPEGMKNLSSTLSKAGLFFGDGKKRISQTEKKMLTKFKYW